MKRRQKQARYRRAAGPPFNSKWWRGIRTLVAFGDATECITQIGLGVREFAQNFRDELKAMGLTGDPAYIESIAILKGSHETQATAGPLP